MKNISAKSKGSLTGWLRLRIITTSAILSVFILAGFQSSLLAQEVQFTRPSWWFGVAAGGNLTFHDGVSQKLNSDFTAPAAFNKGRGLGLYAAPLVEFHSPNSAFGLMFQAGYDNRYGSFEEVLGSCNCPIDLLTKLSYLTLEPSLRYAPFKTGFYLYGGPRFAFNLEKAFTYKQGVNPDFPDQTPVPDVNGDFSDIKKVLISMQIGAGYDIPLSSQNAQTQLVISPFVSFQPYFGQDPRSVETWSLNTLRAGIALKFGVGTEIPAQGNVEVISDPKIRFTVKAPRNIPTVRRVREVFPVRNYVFFDEGSTEIPDRYELLGKNQVENFKEDQLGMNPPKNLSGRSSRQLTVYYNVLNILGDRLSKNPTANVLLVGSSEIGPEDGREMSESIKTYLVNVFGIDASRINTEGRVKPEIPSGQPGGKSELDLLRAGNRRVSIESSSPALLMEFQSGKGAPLKPVEIIDLQEAPIESYVTVEVEGAREAFSYWSLTAMDDSGKEEFFGPYTREKVSIPGKSILGDRPEGRYKMTMIGRKDNGDIVYRETSVHMVLWTPPTDQEVRRFSVIYEFDQSKTIEIYEKYLTEIVTPRIPNGSLVIIHGYTDTIGDEAYNLELSYDRANDVKAIIENALLKAGRSDVTFEVLGFGEDESYSPFDNKFPEERFYNRTVFIDIVPDK
jgi:outer membrane protein OmpA-like peptidoglycan-associated protein